MSILEEIVIKINSLNENIPPVIKVNNKIFKVQEK
jgi:hypothetical protein